MRTRIGRYRRAPIRVGDDPVIGCLFVRDVRFFSDDATAEAPPRFAPNIVQGKSYDLSDPAVAPYFADLLRRILGASVELDFGEPWYRPGPVLGDPRLDPSYRQLVSPCLRADFSNGDQFYAKAGQVIDLPAHRADRPGREFLE
jgi:hypothetical protein